MIGREGCSGLADCQADQHHDDCRASCSACGHEHLEHKDRGFGACEVDVLGIFGFRRCTCRGARKMPAFEEPHSIHEQEPK